ncbi:threonine synthase, partial [bacterium]|nr:threonine synthase [bacterium]
TETAGGVTVGVLKKLAQTGRIKKDELTVAFITGNGLKTQEAVSEAVSRPKKIAPTLKAFTEEFKQM